MAFSHLLIFDLDDTLLNTSDLFFQCREDFIDTIKNTKNDDITLRKRFEEHDGKNVEMFGYSPWRYTLSMVEVYIDLVRNGDGPLNTNILVDIINIGRRAEKTVPTCISDADYVLKNLKANYRLAVLTRGEEFLQTKKLKRYEWDNLFDYVLIVNKKTPDTFHAILDATNIPADHAWSIGDSPKWDILPAKQVGISTILFEHKHPMFDWPHEARSHDSQEYQPNHRVSSLLDLLVIFNPQAPK